MPNLEEAIRERAYHLWIADGQPEGKADIYWLNAQHEIHDIIPAARIDDLWLGFPSANSSDSLCERLDSDGGYDGSCG